MPKQRSVRATGAGEILYVVFTFLIGAVVHSIIIGEARCQLPSDCTAFLHVASGEVIAAVTRVDERGQFITEQRGLLERFAAHTELGEDCVMELQNWVNTEA